MNIYQNINIITLPDDDEPEYEENLPALKHIPHIWPGGKKWKKRR